MRRLKLFITSSALLLFPLLTLAATGLASGDTDGGELGELLQDILTFATEIIIPFILGIGFLLFVWGMFQYFIAGGANDEAKEKGKSLMIYATAGFLIIIIFWGVINVLANFLGWGGEGLDSGTLPVLPKIIE